ncbi:MAG TPA: helix-hairpin-helix domain-containing protein [Acidimicrobiales bacterium]|nr:helix-hairpin-helix domain-containing protein [Acidimicrobiales bacterium]
MNELPRPLPPPSWRDRIGELQSIPVVAVVAVVVAALAVGGTLVFARGGVGATGAPKVELSLPRADAPSSTDASPTTTSGELHVHAAGAVAQPGVVTVPGGSRVTDVVAAAGGPAADADLDQINLAAPVTDGERIYVPHKGEVVAALANGGGAGGAAADAIVNLNDADETALETLPGVGPATARAILDYRTQHGKFRSVDDLLNVRGIGPSKLSQIKPHARV